MLEAFGKLIISSLVMAIGSFFFGNIPLIYKLSNQNTNLVTTFGVGLLLSAAFLLIIPEGVETIYDAQIAMSDHRGTVNRDIGLSLLAGFAFMLLVDQLGSYLQQNTHQPLPVLSMSDLVDRDLQFAPTPTIGFILHVGWVIILGGCGWNCDGGCVCVGSE